MLFLSVEINCCLFLTPFVLFHVVTNEPTVSVAQSMHSLITVFVKQKVNKMERVQDIFKCQNVSACLTVFPSEWGLNGATLVKTNLLLIFSQYVCFLLNRKSKCRRNACHKNNKTKSLQSFYFNRLNWSCKSVSWSKGCLVRASVVMVTVIITPTLAFRVHLLPRLCTFFVAMVTTLTAAFMCASTFLLTWTFLYMTSLSLLFSHSCNNCHSH